MDCGNQKYCMGGKDANDCQMADTCIEHKDASKTY